MTIKSSKRKRIVSCISSLLLTSLITAQAILGAGLSPVYAAGEKDAVIDTSRTGTLTIHKIIENNGTLRNADGIIIENDNLPVSNVGFDHVQIAEFENITGIIVSEKGRVDLESADGMTSVGTYYAANDNLQELFGAAGVIPEAVYIKTSVTDPAASTLQQEFASDVQKGLLAAEQDQADQAKTALEQAKIRLDTARRAYSESVSASLSASGSSEYAQNSLVKAKQAEQEALSAYEAAAEKHQLAADAYTEANRSKTEAETALRNAQEIFDQAAQDHLDPDEGTAARLEETKKEFRIAQSAVKTAKEKEILASQQNEKAAQVLSEAEEALKAAEEILQSVQSLQPEVGSETSETGATNALKYAKEQYDNALSFSNAAKEAAQEAEDASSEAAQTLEAAAESLARAETDLNEALAADNEAYGRYADALKAFNNAKGVYDKALSAQKKAEELQLMASAAQTAAREALDNARSLAEEAQRAGEQAQEAMESQTADTNSLKLEKENAEVAYTTASEAYESVVADLDMQASSHGIIKVYTTETLEKAMQSIIATLGEDRITKWVSENAPTARANPRSTLEEEAEGYTDDRGIVCFSGLRLGLYIVAETDISYHDGYAGAWNDQAEGSINNSSTNHYDDQGYHISPIDAWDQEEVHTYQPGEAYRESVNPEAPVVESPAAPFLISLPTTNTTDTSGHVAAGDAEGQSGTVWQYTVDVYPKNQSTAIYKRIIDPDESQGFEHLRTSEDYQTGDLIEQVIWADAPVLQKNYLFDESDTGFGDGTDGDINDRPSAVQSGNEHLGYVIADTMTGGLSFVSVDSVSIIPKRQLLQFEGCIPETADAFDIVKDAEEDEGQLLTENEDYTVINTNDSQVDLADSEGNVETVVERITTDDCHGFAVVLTDQGLARLNSRTSDSTVVVRFTSVFNKSATIGQVPENMNYPSLYWVNTNTSFKSVKGNEVYDYTYELQLRKNGVSDGRNVRFTIRRMDMDIADGDLAQVKEKDLTDTVSRRQFYGEDDSIRFVKEKDGVYHVWGYIAGEQSDEGDELEEFETSRVNGVTFNTVTPSEDGLLVVKGLDSNDYIFKEIMTEDENNLLKETFTVSLRAADDPLASLRDGRISAAYVTSGKYRSDITIGAAGVSDGQDTASLVAINKGIAAMEVENYDAVDLRMGGSGRKAVYILGSIAAGMALLAIMTGRKRKCADR